MRHLFAFRNGIMPGSSRWTSAPNERKSRAPVGEMFSIVCPWKNSVNPQIVFYAVCNEIKSATHDNGSPPIQKVFSRASHDGLQVAILFARWMFTSGGDNPRVS